MRSHIRLYEVNGWAWLGYAVGNRLHLITRLGRWGDTVRP